MGQELGTACLGPLLRVSQIWSRCHLGLGSHLRPRSSFKFMWLLAVFLWNSWHLLLQGQKERVSDFLTLFYRSHLIRSGPPWHYPFVTASTKRVQQKWRCVVLEARSWTGHTFPPRFPGILTLGTLPMLPQGSPNSSHKGPQGQQLGSLAHSLPELTPSHQLATTWGQVSELF